MLHELIENWRNEIEPNIKMNVKIPNASKRLYNIGKNDPKDDVEKAAKAWKIQVFDAGLSHGKAAKELANYFGPVAEPKSEPKEKMSYRDILKNIYPSDSLSYREAQKKASEMYRNQ